MKKFNKYFSNLAFESGYKIFQSASDQADSGMILMQMALFWGNQPAREIVFDKCNSNLITKLNNHYYKNDLHFNLFIINRIGIGCEVNIKKSNIHLKDAVDKLEVGALLYKSLVEEIRNNEEMAFHYLEMNENSGLLKVRMMELKGIHQHRDEMYEKNLSELISQP